MRPLRLRVTSSYKQTARHGEIFTGMEVCWAPPRGDRRDASQPCFFTAVAEQFKSQHRWTWQPVHAPSARLGNDVLGPNGRGNYHGRG